MRENDQLTDMAGLSVNDFLSVLCSKEPVPGGGGAAALAASMGAALGGMVAALTRGKKKYARYESDLERIYLSCEFKQKELGSLIEKDAEAFFPLSRIYGLPKSTQEEKQRRDSLMETALNNAAQVPLQMMRLSLDCLDLLSELTEKGSIMAVSDVGAGAAMLKSAFESGWLNVLINTKGLKDREMAERLNEEAQELKEKGILLAEEIYDTVEKKLLN